MVPPAVYSGLITTFWLSFHFVVYQQTDLDAKRQDAITRLKKLETEFKGDMTPSCHGDIHEPQESSDTRLVIKTQLKNSVDTTCRL